MFSYLVLSMKLVTTANSRKKHSNVGPNLSSYGPDPLRLIAAALQWYVTNAYIILPIAIRVNNAALILPTLSPKFNNPTPRPPSITVKFNHDRNVRSLAKNTLGSTLVGNAIFFPGVFCNNGADDMSFFNLLLKKLYRDPRYQILYTWDSTKNEIEVSLLFI